MSMTNNASHINWYSNTHFGCPATNHQPHQPCQPLKTRGTQPQSWKRFVSCRNSREKRQLYSHPRQILSFVLGNRIWAPNLPLYKWLSSYIILKAIKDWVVASSHLWHIVDPLERATLKHAPGFTYQPDACILGGILFGLWLESLWNAPSPITRTDTILISYVIDLQLGFPFDHISRAWTASVPCICHSNRKTLSFKT